MKTKRIPLGQFAFDNKYSEFDNEDFIDEITPLIGKIVIYFNVLEERLTSFICEIISDRADAKGLIITHDMSYSSKVNFLNKYVSYTQVVFDKKIPTHEDLIKNLKECSRLRNMVVHAEWDTVDEEGYTFVKLRVNKDGINQEFTQFNTDTLIDILNLIIDTYNSFDVYSPEHWNLFKS